MDESGITLILLAGLEEEEDEEEEEEVCTGCAAWQDSSSTTRISPCKERYQDSNVLHKLLSVTAISKASPTEPGRR